jgi:hypothetical protein
MTILLIVNLSRTLDRRATSGSYTDPVGVGEHQVVVIGYETGRGRGVPGGQRGIREVEQLVTPFVAEGAQIGFDLFYGLLQLRPARSCLIRCKIARISVALTTCLSSVRRVSSSRWKSLRRVSQADVRRARDLSLETDQALYGVKGGDSLPVEQHLSSEGRPV